MPHLSVLDWDFKKRFKANLICLFDFLSLKIVIFDNNLRYFELYNV